MHLQKRYKLICAVLVKSFSSILLHLSEIDRYIPFLNYMKIFNWVRSQWRSQPEIGGGYV